MTFRAPVFQDETGKPLPAKPVFLTGMNGVTVTPVVSASPDYSSGDSIGGLVEVSDLLHSEGMPATVGYVVATSKVSVGADIDLIFFTAEPAASTFTDNAAISIVAADLPGIAGVVTLASASWKALSGTQYVYAAQTAVPLNGQGGKDIWVAAVARGAINLASTTDLSFRISAG